MGPEVYITGGGVNSLKKILKIQNQAEGLGGTLKFHCHRLLGGPATRGPAVDSNRSAPPASVLHDTPAFRRDSYNNNS